MKMSVIMTMMILMSFDDEDADDFDELHDDDEDDDFDELHD